ncbi:MAG: homoserine kinase [Chlamydiales bacterium]|jgi:homoserine kinase
MSVDREVRAFAPASVSNVSCGYDIFGFAVDAPGDEVVVRFTDDHEGAKIVSITGDGGKLPKDAEKNTASVAANALLKHIGRKKGVAIVLHKKMPLGSGLGSSAASAVASVVAVNELLGNPLKKIELLPFVLEGERVACGSAHADNAAPSLLGGFVLVRSYDPLDVVQISVPENLFCAVVHPHMEIPTEKARGILRKELSIKDMVTQCGNVAGLTVGLMTGDFALIGRSLYDAVVEPQRSVLIPGFEEVRASAMNAGALGCGISGAGPSLYALTTSLEKSNRIVEAMRQCWEAMDVRSDGYSSVINHKGAHCI